MKKLGMAAVVAACVGGMSAQSASAATAAPGPCERQQALFETYNIQTNMDAPLVAWAYNTVCDRTG